MKNQSYGYYTSAGTLRILPLLAFLLITPAKSTAQQTLEIEVNVIGLNSNHIAALNQLDEACASTDNAADDQATSVQEVCDLTDTLDETNPDDIITLRSIADAVAPEEAFTIDDSLTISSDYQAVNVNARLNALRKQTSPDQSPEATAFTIFPGKLSNVETSTESGGAAAAGLMTRLGGFLSARISSAELDGGSLQQDTDYDFNNLTLGADYRVSDQIIAGLGVGLIQDETRLSQSSQKTSSDGINFTAYTSWFDRNKAYMDIVLDLGFIAYELERVISVLSDDTLIATASPEVSARSVTMSAGRNFTPFGFDVSGYLRLALTRATIDAYTESIDTQQSDFTPLFSIKKRNLVSTELVLGFEVSKAFSTSHAVIVPRLRLEYITENDRSKDPVEATLISTGTVARYQGQDREPGYTNLGIGASAVFSHGRSAYAYYETHLQHGLISQDTFNIGVRMNF